MVVVIVRGASPPESCLHVLALSCIYCISLIHGVHSGRSSISRTAELRRGQGAETKVVERSRGREVKALSYRDLLPRGQKLFLFTDGV